jgi:hypothetical protein
MGNMKIKDLDEDMKKRIIRAMSRTWDYIGHDLLYETGDISQAEVIEVVLDADRVTSHGGDYDAAKTLYELSYPEMKKLAKEAFPFKRYGI